MTALPTSGDMIKIWHSKSDFKFSRLHRDRILSMVATEEIDQPQLFFN
jgi:hypothetical protein